jgi:hypothetical protein
MAWRRLTGPIGSSPPPPVSFWCLPAQCCNFRPWVRSRITTWSGSAKTCGLNINSYDSAQQSAYYATITGTWTRKWKKDGSTVESCTLTTTVSAPSPINIPTSETCDEGSTESSGECPPPEVCDTPPPCTMEDDPITWAGSGGVSQSALAGIAVSSAIMSAGTWGTFTQALPNIIAGLVGQDQRSIASANYLKAQLELEVAGEVRPFLIEWEDAVTTLGGGGTVQSARSLNITGPGIYTVEWVADPGKRITSGQGMVSIEI